MTQPSGKEQSVTTYDQLRDAIHLDGYEAGLKAANGEIERLRTQLAAAEQRVKEMEGRVNGHGLAAHILRGQLEARDAEILSLTTERDELRRDAERVAKVKAIASQTIAAIRDSVLHGRHQLADYSIDSDITNAVLGVIDDETTSMESAIDAALKARSE